MDSVLSMLKMVMLLEVGARLLRSSTAPSPLIPIDIHRSALVVLIFFFGLIAD
jgi:hypothetical protein